MYRDQFGEFVKPVSVKRGLTVALFFPVIMYRALSPDNTCTILVS